MLVASLVVSAIALVLIGSGYRGGFVLQYSLVSIITILVGCAGSNAALQSCLFLTVLVSICRWQDVRPVRFWAYAFWAAFLPYLIAAPSLVARQRELAELRERYPIQSLTKRLAYEKNAASAMPHRVPPPLTPSTKPTLTEELLKEKLWAPYRKFANKPSETAADEQRNLDLERTEFLAEGETRSRALQSLYTAHSEFVHEFVKAPGFGQFRGPRLLPAKDKYLELPEPEPVSFPPSDSGDSKSSAAADDAALANAAAPTVASEDRPLVEFHTDSVADFANPAGFGYLDWEVRGGERVKTLERVIGFQPHAFRRLPEPPEQQNGAKWRIVQLELVSLLKHDEPVAYVSDHLPRMKELREAPTRPLNAFERDALTQLEAGEDLVVQTLPNTLQMFGSLRALWQCTNCHQVQKGTLLGAFSYRLRRDPAVPQPPGQPALPKPLTWRFRHEAQLLANGNGHPNQSPSLNQQE